MDKIKALMMKLPLMLRCDQAEALFCECCNNELPFSKKMVLRMHVFMCKACRAYLKSYIRTVALVKDSFKDENGIAHADYLSDKLVQTIIHSKKH